MCTLRHPLSYAVNIVMNLYDKEWLVSILFLILPDILPLSNQVLVHALYLLLIKNGYGWNVFDIMDLIQDEYVCADD